MEKTNIIMLFNKRNFVTTKYKPLFEKIDLVEFHLYGPHFFNKNLDWKHKIIRYE